MSRTYKLTHAADPIPIADHRKIMRLINAAQKKHGLTYESMRAALDIHACSALTDWRRESRRITFKMLERIRQPLLDLFNKPL